MINTSDYAFRFSQLTFKFSDLLEQYVILQKKQSTGKKKNEDGYEDGEGGSDEEEEEEEALVCRVYFWQGRDASKVCWPQYSLRLVSTINYQVKFTVQV